jgi:hypothetical protein
MDKKPLGKDGFMQLCYILTIGSESAGHLLQFNREQLTQVPWEKEQ